MAVLISLGSAAFGALLTLLLKSWLDHRTESRTARRALYVELLTMLQSNRAYMQAAVYDPEAKPAHIPDERVDRLNALLKIDATPAVRSRSGVCLELINRFRQARAHGAPIERDANGYYVYQRNRVGGLDEEGRAVVMRLALTDIELEYGSAIDALAEQVQKELHGRRTRRVPRR